MSKRKLRRWSYDSADRASYTTLYPWQRLSQLGYDSWWEHDNIHPSSDIFRNPSCARRQSYVVHEDKLLKNSQSGMSITHDSAAASTITNMSPRQVNTRQTVPLLENVSPGTSCREAYNKLPPFDEIEIEVKQQDEYLFNNFNLFRYNIIRDGNCLYRAISQALVHDQNQHTILRKEVTSFIRDNVNDFKELIEGDVNEYLDKSMQEQTWAGYLEILACTKLFGINAVIVLGGSVANPKVSVTCHNFTEEFTPRDTIWLSWLSNGHYDLVTDCEVENDVAYEKWRRERRNSVDSDAELAARLSGQTFDEEQQWLKNEKQGMSAAPDCSGATYARKTAPKTNSRRSGKCNRRNCQVNKDYKSARLSALQEKLM